MSQSKKQSKSEEQIKTKKLYLMIEAETYNQILNIAEKEDRSMSKTAMRMIRLGLKNYGQHGQGEEGGDV